MQQTKLLRDFVEELWLLHASTWGEGRTLLHVTSPAGDQLHIEYNRTMDRIHMCYYVAQPDGTLVKDLNVVFTVLEPDRWVPIEFCRMTRGRHVYVQVDTEAETMTLTDPVNQRACAAYCDTWSFHLRDQGWLEKGVLV